MDPDQTQYDTDGDGVPDKVEYEFGVVRGYGFSPTQADADGDGLNDATEMRYATNPRKADTDGDGITDFDEIYGYTLSIRGRTIHTTSNPVIRDSDQDGMSDGVERRLNGVDAARYPFHPLVFNDPPVRLYSELDDLDPVSAVGASTIVTTTVVNGTAIENELIATGTFFATLPGNWAAQPGRKTSPCCPAPAPTSSSTAWPLLPTARLRLIRAQPPTSFRWAQRPPALPTTSSSTSPCR